MIWDDLIGVGRIVRPHGRRGEVVVAPDTDFGAKRFEPGAVLFSERDGRVDALRVRSGREHQGRWVVGFEGIDTITDAEALRGRELRIAQEELQSLEDGRYYLHDLVGCEVMTVGGQTIGTVRDVEVGAGAALLVIGRGESEDVLVPFTDAICRVVDVPGKSITIDAPEGLLELNERARR